MVHNFNAGPSILPGEVIEQASRAILDFNDTGSVHLLEIGHRTPLFQAVIDEAIATARQLMRLDSDHEVLFLHGGASTQFFQVPMNLLGEGQTAAYLDCGVFGGRRPSRKRNCLGRWMLCGEVRSDGRTTPISQKGMAFRRRPFISIIRRIIRSKGPRCMLYRRPISSW